VPAIVQLLLDGRTRDVHARTSATFQDVISADQLDRAWRGRTRDLGPAADILISCRGPADHIVADITITFASGAVAGWIGFDPSGQITGLRILPPQEATA
jgi:hypothetical protein